MPAYLSTLADHPARIIADDLKPVFHPAANYLLDHEVEHDVTFAALDNTALQDVVEAWEAQCSGQLPGAGAGTDLADKVAALLRLKQ